MPQLPDFLMNMAATSPNLVEDSPRFREEEQRIQWENLNKASATAMKEIEKRTQQATAAANMAKAQEIEQGMGLLDQITARPSPLSGPGGEFYPDIPPEMDSPLTPNIPGPEEFASSTPMPSPLDPADPLAQPEPEDPIAEVERIAAETGIPAQTVAAMTLLGKDIERLQTQPSSPESLPTQEPAPPPIMSEMPNPLTGPPPTAPPPAQQPLLPPR